MAEDYYDILGVSKDASQEEIKKAYRSKAMKYHPDRGEGGDEDKFKKINEAYQVLSDEDQRKRYDQFGKEGTDKGSGAGGFGGFGRGDFRGGQRGSFDFDDFESIFDTFFGGRSRGGTARQRNDNNVRLELNIDFDEMVHGVEKELSYQRYEECDRCAGSGAEPDTELKTCDKCDGQGQIRAQQRTILGTMTQVQVCDKCEGRGEVPEEECTQCNGTGREKTTEEITIEVPAGVQDGTILKFAGRGDAGRPGEDDGDLLVTVNVSPSEKYDRDALDLYKDISISYPTAVLGGQIEVDTPHGKAEVKVPQGSSEGKLLKLAGEGINTQSRSGDLYLKVHIDIPEEPTLKQKKLLEELKENLEEEK